MKDKYYYSDGSTSSENDYSKQLHRVDGPAVEYANGSKYWYLNGKRHRVDGPAIEWANGYKYWYLNGECHRVDGPAIEHNNGDKYWYLNDKKIICLEGSKLVDEALSLLTDNQLAVLSVSKHEICRATALRLLKEKQNENK